MAQWSTTYAALVSLLETFVEDASSEFVAAVQGCINRGEERLFRDLDLSLFNRQLATNVSTGVSPLAKSFSESQVNSIFFTASAIHAERRQLSWVQAMGGSGVPKYFYEDETGLYWAPVPDANYAVVIGYARRPTPLSDSNTSNWFAVNVADLLLYAALVESEKFLIAPERVQEFEGTYRNLLGPARAYWRGVAQTDYEPVAPTPEPRQTR